MFFEPQTKTLLYNGPRAAVVLMGVPSVRVGQYAAVKINLANFQALAKLGVPVPDPMAGYDWPCRPGEKPMAIQKETASFLALNPRAFVLSEMRTGKTRAALWAADWLMERHPGMKCLVVANLSTLRRTWDQEIFNNFIGRRKSVVLHSHSADARKKLLNEDADFYIINHDGVGVGTSVGRRGLSLRGFGEALFARREINIAILDEATAYRDATTRRSRIARTYFANFDYVWALTGTPTPNAPTDAHGLGKLVIPEYTESFRSLQSRTMTQISQFKWLPKAGANEIVKSVLAPAIRFTQEDCFDAPPQTIELRDVALSAEQRTYLAELKRECHIQLKTGSISAANEAVLRMKLFQICGGAVYDSLHKTHLIDNKPRLAVLKEIIEAAPKKVIVFSPLTNMIVMIKAWLDNGMRDTGYRGPPIFETRLSSGVGMGCLINGETPMNERTELLRQFQADGGPRVLVAHPGPIARGLDLTSAATIVWFTPTDRTEDYIQANQRINGPAQNQHRHIIQLAATAVEREVFKRLDRNEALQGAMLKLVEQGE
jgi:SNF2 family DNA or RNA helicase